MPQKLPASQSQLSINRVSYAAAALLIWMLGAAAQAHAEEVIGRVIAVQGSADIREGEVVSRGTAIYQGDMINTGSDARLRMRFVGGSVITLGGDSRFEVATYQPARGQAPQRARFRLLDGVVLAFAEGVTGAADEDYVIETQAASMGIRGTIVWGGYFIADQADFVLFKGGPVEIFNDLGTVVLTELGQGTTVQVDEMGVGIQPPDPPDFWTPEKAFEATTTIAF